MGRLARWLPPGHDLGRCEKTVDIDNVDHAERCAVVTSPITPAGIPGEVAARFVADLSHTGVPVHPTNREGFARAAGLDVIREHWEAVSARLEDLAQEVSSHLG